MLRAMLRFGTISGTAAAGLFLMTLMADTGTGHAQVFFLQGQDGADGDSVFTCAGGTCTTNSNIVISGELQTNAVTANGLTTVDELIVRRTHTLPACPEGYEQDDSQSDITVCARGLDEMVRVGNVWIDRYESLIVDGDYWDEGRCLGAAGSQVTDLYPAPAFFPDTGDWTLPLYACSVPGVTPSHSLTYYQAQAACALAGKRLCLNEEWQAAAQGTVDPGSNNGLANTQCNTNSAGIRNTGLAGSLAGDSNSCISRWGAEDMIGNMSEIVSTIFGHPGSNGIVNSMLPAYGSDGYVGGGPRASSMPAAGTDNSWRARNPAFLGQADGATDPVSPAIALRGGMHQQSTRAGTFAMDLSAGPAHFHTTIGFRCCRGR